MQISAFVPTHFQLDHHMDVMQFLVVRGFALYPRTTCVDNRYHYSIVGAAFERSLGSRYIIMGYMLNFAFTVIVHKAMR